jgi:hypothetical protein
MTRKWGTRMNSRRVRFLAVGGLLVLPALLIVPGAVTGSVSPAQAARSAAGAAASSAPAAASTGAAFSATEKISRVNLVNGANQVVDRRTFSVTVGQTQLLRDRQEIDVSWHGAHPTGGILPDENSEEAAYQEYPVVLMMCRGTASTLSPETCWTQTSAERVQTDTTPMEPNTTIAFPPYRLDRYATTAERGPSFGVPAKLPSACAQYESGVLAQYWVPFKAAGGQVYDFGPAGCAGLPPEAANAENELQPGNTTYGQSDKQGNGSDKFVITTDETNASLGCSDTVACSLVVIPIMGISCDPSALSLPPADRPPSEVQAEAFAECSQTGYFAPGEQGNVDASNNTPAQLAVTGALWWSASNWRNRIVVPLTFAPPSNICQLGNSSATPVLVYGSYLLLQATEQWSPHFCLNPKLFVLQHVEDSEPAAKLLLGVGAVDAVFQGSPPPTPFTNHVVQAPTAATGWVIAFDIDGPNGQPIAHLRLDARLLAKLLTESYPESNDVRTGDNRTIKAQKPSKGHKGHKAYTEGLLHNPLNMGDDPEFLALNPGIGSKAANLSSQSAASLLVLSSSSDAMWALTSYINADPEARAWLNGKPDPWGMVVNPAYKGIKLPVSTWPLLDTWKIPEAEAESNGNQCVVTSPVPWLPQIAAPVEDMEDITLDLQFDISASQIDCEDAGGPDQQLVALGRETPGQDFILGLTSLADADRYKLDTAELETQGGSTSDKKFTTSKGRSFAGPSNASLRAALALMQPSDTLGSWTMPYSQMRTESAGKSAYPGTMLISTDVLTKGIAKPLARDYCELIDFAATSGQQPGLGNGQLAAGYLPMTAANGMAKMVAYAKEAAGAVAAQKGEVPGVMGTYNHPKPCAPATRSHPSPSPTTSHSSPSASPTTGQVSPSAATSISPSSSSSAITLPTVSPATSPQQAQITGYTRSALSGALLPLVLLIALIVGTAGFAVWQLRPARPRREP